MAIEVTKSEYARLCNVSAAYVSKLAKQGKLVYSACGKRIDVEATNALLKRTADPSKDGVRARWERERGQAMDGEGPAPDDAVADLPAEGGYSFQAARAKRETHLANIAEMDERRRLGELVETKDVQRALTDYAAASRVALQQLADRLAPALALESDPEVVYQLIDAEIRTICDQIRNVAEALPQSLAEQHQ